MKVYCELPQPSLGLQRIRDALVRYAPEWVEIVSTQAEADLVVIYAIGRRDHLLRQTGWLLNRGKQYAIIQVCLRSTLTPMTDDWIDIWNDAKCVWSYYDLNFAIGVDDGADNWENGQIANFYHAPLGVDSSVFYPRDRESKNGTGWIILTSGPSRLQESVRECEIAAGAVSRYMAHLGPKVSGKPHVDCLGGLTDEQLAIVYSTCDFVSGLRRTEGFELPAAEGLLCGARPIVFGTPDYHFNYREFAEYVYEGTRQEVVDQLVQLFQQGPRPVSEVELREARWWFDWQRIIGGFYERLR